MSTPRTPAADPGALPLAQVVDALAAELHERVEQQRRAIQRLVDAQARGHAYCPLVDCPRLARLRAAVREAIEVLEATRGAFKSHRLEVMRKKLTDVLSGG
ncbi:MAG TPA: hypothetical protein PLE19_05455 [Planctomycetota bacterium]|nr:hypothetical protein [Planctomycetota bacterium]HRR80181.1 hypothetical protein [Planctomycetota bacterium]HRT94734.1 hypothetical protein [Planctomycetota bacterium]